MKWPQRVMESSSGLSGAEVNCSSLGLQCPAALRHAAEWKPWPRQGPGGAGQGLRAEGATPLRPTRPVCPASRLRSGGPSRWAERSAEPGKPEWWAGRGAHPAPTARGRAPFLPRSEPQSGPLRLTILRGIFAFGIRSFL